MNIDENPEWNKYMEIIKNFMRKGYSNRDTEDRKSGAWANSFEEKYMLPFFPNDIKKKFNKSKSVIKYVNLKIMGEVIGGLLQKLRSKMYSDMLESSQIENIIKKSKKKTICFTTYTDVVRSADKYLTNKGFTTTLAYGETSKNIKENLDRFRTEEDINPLIATIQTLSTGVTLIEANTIIFFNKPWRYTDLEQAKARIHRIGQDETANFYYFLLDTGSEPNLSTRMEDIVSWSKEMFEGIVGKDLGEFEKVKKYNELFYN